jgi:8-oxo-dGTP pyrophosphatase MutT (NUDIX family)
MNKNKKQRKHRKKGRSREFHQSAVIPIYGDQVVMITTRSRGFWVIPKGIVEPDLSPQDSAAKEAWEEAGIKGKVKKRRVGTYRYQKWGGTCHVEVFVMEVKELRDKFPENTARKRKLMDPKHAIKRAHPQALSRLLKRHFRKQNKS